MVQTNAHLIQSPHGNVLIDAPEGVSEWLDELGVRVDCLLLTHQHYDHVEGAAELQRKGVEIRAFAEFSDELTLEAHAREWGMPIHVEPFRVDRLIAPGLLEVAGYSFVAAHVPGHALDGMTFYLKDAGVVFSGDTLFAGSVGRPDLPGGDMDQLIDGIRSHLLGLPKETRVLSGHGPATTIGREAGANPYLS